MSDARPGTIWSWMGRNSFFLTLQALFLGWALYEWNSEPFFLFMWIACWIAFAAFRLIWRLVARE